MRKLGQLIGSVVFWLSYPLLRAILNNSQRTRVLIIVDDSFLVLKGWLGTGRWGLPGGGIHKNETALVAAVRELEEETGLVVEAEALELLFHEDVRQIGITIDCTGYSLRLPKRPTINPQFIEVSQYTWLPLADLNEKSVSKDVYLAVKAWTK